MSVEIAVPDIGDFKDVPVIEVHVQVGAKVAVDETLVTLESDKATMDIPAPRAGTVTELRIKPGDRVSQGSLILLMEPEGAAAIPPKERIREDATPAATEPPGYGSASGVYAAIEVKVPDIGDFKDVPVIEVHVQPGAEVKAEEPLVSLESDKATMDIPAPVAGRVQDVRVKLGDRVSEGSCCCCCRLVRPARFLHPDPHRPHGRPSRRRAISMRKCWCSAPVRAVTPPPSVRRTSARRSSLSSAGRSLAASA